MHAIILHIHLITSILYASISTYKLWCFRFASIPFRIAYPTAVCFRSVQDSSLYTFNASKYPHYHTLVSLVLSLQSTCIHFASIPSASPNRSLDLFFSSLQGLDYTYLHLLDIYRLRRHQSAWYVPSISIYGLSAMSGSACTSRSSV